jgi:hypothetical protein
VCEPNRLPRNRTREAEPADLHHLVINVTTGTTEFEAANFFIFIRSKMHLRSVECRHHCPRLGCCASVELWKLKPVAPIIIGIGLKSKCRFEGGVNGEFGFVTPKHPLTVDMFESVGPPWRYFRQAADFG